jgi:hypothetical protein
MDFKPKTTLEEIIKMLSETMGKLDDFDGLSFNIDDWSPEFSPVDDLYFDPFFGLDIPDEPWYGPQKEQLSWDIRDFEPYEAGRLNSPNREEG